VQTLEELCQCGKSETSSASTTDASDLDELAHQEEKQKEVRARTTAVEDSFFLLTPLSTLPEVLEGPRGRGGAAAARRRGAKEEARTRRHEVHGAGDGEAVIAIEQSGFAIS